MTSPRRLAALTAAVLACAAAASCSLEGASDATGRTVTLVTHDSFALDPALLEEFTAATGLSVRTAAPGDGGELVNQLILTASAPLGDAVYGIDNTYASRAVDAGVLAPYTSPAAGAEQDRFVPAELRGKGLTAVDYSDVCVNVDHGWFTAHDLPEPATLQDLADPRYQDLLVVTNPATSSPGMAFLLATIGAFGTDGYLDYWRSLVDNGVKVDAGWSDAYYVDFSGSQGAGPRPLVLSYASSPPVEVPEGSDTAPTGALLETCFRQVEYAGVIAGAADPDGAGKLVDFLLSKDVQADLPTSMYVYPVTDVALPAAWAAHAPLSDHPFTVSPEQVDAHRSEWIEAWTSVVVDS